MSGCGAGSEAASSYKQCPLTDEDAPIPLNSPIMGRRWSCTSGWQETLTFQETPLHRNGSLAALVVSEECREDLVYGSSFGDSSLCLSQSSSSRVSRSD